MLDRLPPSLQQHLLLEWLSPSAVCAVARAGSVQVRHAVLTTPRAFQAAKGEVVREATVRWFRRQEKWMPPLILQTTVEKTMMGEFHEYNGRSHREDDLPAVIWCNGTEEWWWYGYKYREEINPNARVTCWRMSYRPFTNFVVEENSREGHAVPPPPFRGK